MRCEEGHLPGDDAAPIVSHHDRLLDPQGVEQAGEVADQMVDRVGADRVGCIRHFHTRDGGMIREKLLALSDYEYSCTYEILESPMGVSNYVATLKLTPVTDGTRCFAEWSAEFDCDAGREGELTQSIGNGVFQGGFNALKLHFGGR